MFESFLKTIAILASNSAVTTAGFLYILGLITFHLLNASTTIPSNGSNLPWHQLRKNRNLVGAGPQTAE